jgi:hypothetical protein
LDAGDHELWLSCFCLDARLEFADWSTSTTASYGGPDQLREFARIASPPGSSVRRWLNLPIVEWQEGGARLRTYELQFDPKRSDRCSAIASGILDCELRKVDGEWLYSAFRLTIEDFEHDAWTANAMEGLKGCGGHMPHVDLRRGSVGVSAQDLDRELILQTIAKFLFYMDDGSESERLADLFTEDGQWHLFGVNQLYRSGAWHGKAMDPVYRGRAVIRAFNQAAHAQRGPWDRHWGHAPHIRIEGEVATAVFQYSTVLAGVGEHVRPMIAGVYHDRFCKVDGRWLIQDCAVFIERTPNDVEALLAAASDQYVGGAD